MEQTEERLDTTDHTEDKVLIHSEEGKNKGECFLESIVEHLDVVMVEELVPESGSGNNKDAGIQKRGDGDTEEDGESREDETVEREEDMEDEERRQVVVSCFLVDAQYNNIYIYIFH